MLILRKYQGNLLVFIKDTIACYNFESKSYSEHKIPKLQSTTDSRIISSVCISKQHDYLAVALSNKQLVVFDKLLNILASTVSNRIVSQIRFTLDNDLLIADKTGDVFVCKWSSKEEPKLLLGHLSMLLDIELSECGKYVFTSDRDEKIRVSCYPNAYNIVSFCLGHSEFVTNVAVHGGLLISASGDGTIRLWNYMSGEELELANSNEYIANKAVISDYRKKMSDEGVDAEALPITDMQVYARDGVIHVGVTVFGINGVQIYIVDVTYETITYSETIMVSSPLLSFLLDEELIIVTCNDFSVYEMQGDKYVPIKSSIRTLITDCEDLLTDYVNTSSSFVSTLYKRKYDNVQDYLDKKKMRLANKS